MDGFGIQWMGIGSRQHGQSFLRWAGLHDFRKLKKREARWDARFSPLKAVFPKASDTSSLEVTCQVLGIVSGSFRLLLFQGNRYDLIF